MTYASGLSDIVLDTFQPHNGVRVLSELLRAAHSALDALKEPVSGGAAQVGHLRGTGPEASFSRWASALERDHPRVLQFPFEGSDRVGGAAWLGSELIGPHEADGVAKLHWMAGAGDLPMHTHETSGRFIVVLEGRGFFHCTDQGLEDFDGSRVRTIAARERDIFAFTAGVVHTFSTTVHAMTLLSVHLPYLPLDSPDQYALPKFRWTAEEHLRGGVIQMGGWQSLLG